MDRERILDLLRKTTAADPTVREPAEANLISIHKIIGFTPTLLNIVLDQTLELHLRQAAVIYLKNNVLKYWDTRHLLVGDNGQVDPSQFIIHDHDKRLISDAIVDSIVTCGQSLLSIHLSSIVNSIIKSDFPHKWPGVVEKIRFYLAAEDRNAWSGALMTFYQLAKIYEYRNATERKPFIEALSVLLPLTRERLEQLVEKDPLSEQSCKLQKQILKTFHAILQYSLPLAIITNDIFSQWMKLILTIAQRDIPDAVQVDVDPEDRPDLIWWKCKKWALHLLSRIFERYGSPNNVQKEYKKFAEWYIVKFSPEVLGTISKILDQYALNHYVSPRVMQQTLNYLNTAVLHSITWKMLENNIMVVVEKIIFPLMCHSKEDDELWRNDPREYIKMKFDIFEEYVSPVSASQNLLHSLCKKRRNMLQKTMNLVINILNNPAADPKAIDGALHMVGSISSVLLKKPMFKEQLEQLIVTYVIPLFSCPHGFLKSRACWVLNYFAAIEYKNQNNMLSATQSILQCTLSDRDLPVKVEAALCLQSLLHAQAKAPEIIKPAVKQLTLELVEIIRQTESEDVMEVLQKIVYLFPEDLYAIAVDMTTHLAQTFHQLIQAGENEEDEKISAAMAVLSTIDTVLTMMDEKKEVVAKLEPIVVNIIQTIFEQSISELYEEATTLLSTITADAVSQESWRCFKTLYMVFKRDGPDYFTDMMSPIHNYITVDPQTFLSTRDNIGAIYDMCQSMLNDPNGNEELESYAAKLLEIVILQFKDQINDCVPSFVELAITRLRREIGTAELRTLLLQIVIATLYSNHQLLFEIFQRLEQQGNLPPNTLFDSFITQWLKDLDELFGLHDRKMSIIGFCTLIMLPADKRPPIVFQIANQIVPSILTLCERLKIAYEKKDDQDSETDSDEDCDEDSDNEAEVLEDDQDHVGMHSAIADDGADDDDQFEDIADDADLSDIDEYDSLPDEDCEPTALESFETLIDTDKGFVDEFFLFKDTMEKIRQTDANWYQMLLVSLNESQQKRLMELGEYINKRSAILAVAQANIAAAQANLTAVNQQA